MPSVHEQDGSIATRRTMRPDEERALLRRQHSHLPDELLRFRQNGGVLRRPQQPLLLRHLLGLVSGCSVLFQFFLCRLGLSSHLSLLLSHCLRCLRCLGLCLFIQLCLLLLGFILCVVKGLVHSFLGFCWVYRSGGRG